MNGDRIARADVLPRRALVVWVVLRLPVLAALLFAMRAPFITWFEQHIGIEQWAGIVMWSIATSGSRLLVATCAVVALAAVVAVVEWRWPTPRGRLAVAALAGAMALVAMPWYWSRWLTLPGLALSALVGCNVGPDRRFHSALAALPRRRLSCWLLAVVPGTAELIAWRPLLAWIGGAFRGTPPIRLGALGPVVTALPAALFLAAALDGGRLVAVDRGLHRDPAVRRAAIGDVCDVLLDRERGRLYVVGHGTNWLRVLDAATLRRAAPSPRIATGNAQAAAFAPEHHEAFVYNGVTRRLLVIDTTTLTLRESWPMPKIATGDVWVTYEPSTDLVTVVSESDVQDGIALVSVERASGREAARLQLEMGQVLQRVDRPWLYVSPFRRTNEIVLFDLAERTVRARAAVVERPCQMAYWPERDEVLVASPVQRSAVRIDANTLEHRGQIPTQWGARSLQLDSRRNLLISGSLFTGNLVFVDLGTRREVASFYLGPQIRNIVLDEEAGIAFVSSIDGLFRVEYAKHLD